ncbi:MAG: hypothetical protein ACRBCI_15710 [Cellvibrionaceae bacterium]
MSETTNDSIYSGLKALAESSFPKKCNTCNETYQTAEEFIAKTQHVRPDHSGLKSSADDDGSEIVELFRNCLCGSTLMDAFTDRRDLSESGEARRQNFDKLLVMIQDRYSIERTIARDELLKIMRGEASQIIKHIIPAPR